MSGNSNSMIRVRADPANPGQFFACCGLLELADRLWGGVEGWHAAREPFFCLKIPGTKNRSVAELVQEVTHAGLQGELSPALEQERQTIESKRRRLKREGKALTEEEENRRKELGTLLREGIIVIPTPFNLRLDWWQGEGDDIPKTWAGSQQVLRIAQAALDALPGAFTTERPFDYCCVLRPPREDTEASGAESDRAGRARTDGTKGGKVEPFYFDARRGASALPIDIGFSPDSLSMISGAYPAVEFLCLVGLQRFRPALGSAARVFRYYTWTWPLAASVASLAACGLLSHVGGKGFRFENAFRTDQRKHKAFTAGTPIYRSNDESEQL
jgi:hypothetical protein